MATYPPEYTAFTNTGRFNPSSQSGYRAGWRTAGKDADHVARALLIRLTATDLQADALDGELKVLHCQSRQFAAAKGRSEPGQQQRPVA